MPLESTLCVLSPKSCVVVIGMNPQTSSARRTKEGIANAGELDNQVSPLEEVVVGDQVSVAPPPMADGYIRASFLKMSQYITTQAQVITTEAQTMMDLHNWEVVPRGNKQVSTMASCKRISLGHILLHSMGPKWRIPARVHS